MSIDSASSAWTTPDARAAVIATVAARRPSRKVAPRYTSTATMVAAIPASIPIGPSANSPTSPAGAASTDDSVEAPPARAPSTSAPSSIATEATPTRVSAATTAVGGPVYPVDHQYSQTPPTDSADPGTSGTTTATTPATSRATAPTKNGSTGTLVIWCRRLKRPGSVVPLALLADDAAARSGPRASPSSRRPPADTHPGSGSPSFRRWRSQDDPGARRPRAAAPPATRVPPRDHRARRPRSAGTAPVAPGTAPDRTRHRRPSATRGRSTRERVTRHPSSPAVPPG